MRSWALLLGGLLVWAADFFLLYAIASIFLDTMTARVLSVLVTLAALAADAALIMVSWRRYNAPPDDYGRWIAWIGFLGAILSALAVLWQGLPPLLI